MSQADLFDPPAETKRCGTCVVLCRRWGETGVLPEGDCSRHGRRQEDAPACDQWFGLGELRKALYGRKL